jgi:hypothetical protein
MPMKKKACIFVDKQNFLKKYLRQLSIDFDFCNISSSCDVVYKGCWLTQAGYWKRIFYNSVTKYFVFICFDNLPLGIPSGSVGSTHTYIPLMCVGHE